MKYIGISVSVLGLLSSSCTKWVTVDAPVTQLVTANVFQNDQTASSAISGLYFNMISPAGAMFSGGSTLYGGMSADEVVNFTTGANDDFSTNSLNAGNNIVKAMWDKSYNCIYQANSIIEGLSLSTGITQATKQQLTGEALCIRAMSHFYLVNFFGDIPLIVTTDYRRNAKIGRTTAKEIYSQVIKDLNDAKLLLKEDYPSAQKVRPNKWTATALLSRAYLYMEDYANAILNATEVIQSGKYIINTNPKDVFLANSTESIWQLMPVAPNLAVYDATQFIRDNTIAPLYTIRPSLMAAFEPDDKRKAEWIGSHSFNSNTTFYPIKYRNRTTTVSAEYYTVIRLAEQYLIRAEASARLNKLPDAISDIDVIRKRAGLPLVKDINPGIDAALLLIQIQKERRLELFAEWGHRWFDLKRTGKINEVLGLEKSATWQPEDALYPIPQSQVDINPLLIQNPNY